MSIRSSSIYRDLSSKWMVVANLFSDLVKDSTYNIGKFVINELIYNGHIQALGAGGVVYLSSLIIFNKSFDALSFILTYLIFIAIFMHDRYIHLERDHSTNPVRTLHLLKYSTKIPIILILIVLLQGIFLFYISSYIVTIFSLSILVAGIMYPLYVKDLTKKIIVFKNLYVSFVYALLVYWNSVYLQRNLLFTTDMFVFALLIFAASFISQVELDYKDIESDQKIGYLTLPVILGKERLYKVIIPIVITVSVIGGYFVLAVTNNSSLTFLIITNAVIDIAAIILIYRSKIIGYILTTSKFMIFFFLALIFSSWI